MKPALCYVCSFFTNSSYVNVKRNCGLCLSRTLKHQNTIEPFRKLYIVPYLHRIHGDYFYVIVEPIYTGSG